MDGVAQKFNFMRLRTIFPSKSRDKLVYNHGMNKVRTNKNGDRGEPFFRSSDRL